jgi:hypothetical protein
VTMKGFGFGHIDAATSRPPLFVLEKVRQAQ